jgi:hypothetical protein
LPCCCCFVLVRQPASKASKAGPPCTSFSCSPLVCSLMLHQGCLRLHCSSRPLDHPQMFQGCLQILLLASSALIAVNQQLLAWP